MAELRRELRCLTSHDRDRRQRSDPGSSSPLSHAPGASVADLILGVWLLGGVSALSGALTSAELGGMIPEAGAWYRFLAESYGGLTGFLYGWTYFLVVNTGGLGALALAFATYLGYLVPTVRIGVTMVAIGGLILVTIRERSRPRRQGRIFRTYYDLEARRDRRRHHPGNSSLEDSSMPSTSTLAWPAEGRSLPGAFRSRSSASWWSIGGWQHATYTAAEAKNPAHTSGPAALLSSVPGRSFVLYSGCERRVYSMLLRSSADSVLPSALLLRAAETVLGPVGGSAIATSRSSSQHSAQQRIYTLTSARIYFAMARDGLFFKSVATVHPRFHTPAWAIIPSDSVGSRPDLFLGNVRRADLLCGLQRLIFLSWRVRAVSSFRRKRPEPTGRTARSAILGPPSCSWRRSVFVLMTMIEKPAQAGAGLLFLLSASPSISTGNARTDDASPRASTCGAVPSSSRPPERARIGPQHVGDPMKTVGYLITTVRSAGIAAESPRPAALRERGWRLALEA